MMNKLVSVIIPVYNVESFVRDALSSIANQTYSNLEIIVIDDASSDNTYEIISEMAKIDSRFRIFRNSHNIKIAKTLNLALSLAKGEYIARMDGDDISELDRVQKKIDYLEENPDIDLVGCSVLAIDANGSLIGKTKHYSNFDFIKRTIKFVSPCSHIWIARKKLYDELNGYRDIPGAEDYDFLLRSITSGFKITNLQNYYGYRVRLGRPGNTANSIGLRQRLLQKYVFGLYVERINNGSDNFSADTMNENIAYSNLSHHLFLLSHKFLMKAIKSAGLFKVPARLLYLILSMCSPHQVAYLASRMHYKYICWRSEF